MKPGGKIILPRSKGQTAKACCHMEKEMAAADDAVQSPIYDNYTSLNSTDVWICTKHF